MEKYRETHHGYWILFLITIAIISIAVKMGNYNSALFVIAILGFFMVVFYKLTILINSEEITAFFNFGLFKRKIKISEIDFESIRPIKTNWLTGVGIRYTRNGWLYNVKPGDAIIINSKDNSKTFFVGTDNFAEIKKVLLQESSKK